MTNYGVVSTGFKIKPLSAILAELEQANIETFGAGVVQTAQTPLGQWNGLRADAIALLWELAESEYQSYDPDQAEGTRLDILARLRLLERIEGESDAAFAAAITNEGRARIRNADFYRAVMALDGVTWARIYSNDTGAEGPGGMPPNSVTVAAIGGDDDEIALAARKFIVPGITISGNTYVSTNIDGYCQSIAITRPWDLPVTLEVDVSKGNDQNGCPPPSNEAIAEALANALTGANRPANGVTITDHIIRSALCTLPNVEVVEARVGRGNDTPTALPCEFNFYEIAQFDLARITVDAS